MDAHLRYARSSRDLASIASMYCEGLGLEVLGSFTGHAGFDGVMVGQPGASYHFEFTQEAEGEWAGPDPLQDQLLVFYLPDREAWRDACERMHSAGFKRVSALNPYWDRSGCTFEDLDGYRVVLQNSSWPAE